MTATSAGTGNVFTMKTVSPTAEPVAVLLRRITSVPPAAVQTTATSAEADNASTTKTGFPIAKPVGVDQAITYVPG